MSGQSLPPDTAPGLRPTMEPIIRRLRRLLGDPNRETWQFDEDLQETLDSDYRSDWRYQVLRAAESIMPGGRIVFLDFYAPASCGSPWEGDTQLVDCVFNPLTPATENLFAGHWTFTAQPTGLQVYASGKTYDLYGAAADLLEEDYAANRGRLIDTTDASGASIKRGQAARGTLDLIAEYRSKQLAQSVGSQRSDVGNQRERFR